MILAFFWQVLAVASVSGNTSLRVYQGQDDHLDRFPFAVVLHFTKLPDHRICSGSLVANDWVLTAAHCVLPYPMIIRYGDFTSNHTDLFSNVIQQFIYPNAVKVTPAIYTNDIALLLIGKVRRQPARLSAVDYKAVVGMPVEYAGFGRTGKPFRRINQLGYKPLQVGEGVVIPCPENRVYSLVTICVASKCSARGQQPRRGDSGGPLVHDGRIVGVASAIAPHYTEYTAVSPYLQWIHKTMKTYGYTFLRLC